MTSLPPFLQHESGTDFIRFTGHRIGLAEVIRCYNEGDSAELLRARFPTLPLATIYSALAFYLEHEIDVDRYVAAEKAVLLQQEGQGYSAKYTLAELRSRFDVMRRAGS